MQTCYNCGRQVDDSVLICPDCGALVKRYASVSEPQTAEPEAQADGSKWIFTGKSGRLCLHGFLKFWLILGLAFSAFFLLSYGLMFLTVRYQNEFYAAIDEIMSIPEYAPFIDVWQTYPAMIAAIVEVVSEYRVMFLICMALTAVKIACASVFLARISKKSFLVYLISCLVLTVMMSISGSSPAIIAIEGIVIAFLLRRDFQKLA